MSSLQGMLNRVLSKDVCVYWANPVPDLYGKKTYDTPVEISCFWVESAKTIRMRDGKEVTPNSMVYLLQDVVNGEMLYHGPLSDLSAEQKTDPRKIANAYEVIRFNKTPGMVNSGVFERIAYLNETTT